MWPTYPKIHPTNKNTGVMVENKYEEYSSVILKHLGGNTALHSLIFNNTVKSHILVNAWSTPPPPSVQKHAKPTQKQQI